MNKVVSERITLQPEILCGKPVIRSLRISVAQIVKSAAAGVSFSELLADYPELELQDIEAALSYAAMLVEEQKYFPIKLAK